MDHPDGVSSSAVQPTLADRRPLWREGVLVACLYASLTFVLAFPLTIHPGSTAMVIGFDTDYFLWALGWNLHALTHQPLSMFDANIFYPYRHTLAYSENLLGSALMAAPFVWLTGNLVLGMNAVVLLSCVLCGVGTYLLARRLGLSPAASVLGGVIFAFAPPRFFRLAQLHLATVQWVPFCLASLHAYLDVGRKRDLWWASAFFMLQALTSGHGAVFTVLAVGLLVGWRTALGEPLRPWKRVRDLGVAGALLLALGVLVFLPYHAVQQEMGLRRTLGDGYRFAPNAASFLASLTHVHTFVLSLMTDEPVLKRANALLFPGYLTVGLATVALWPSFTRSHDPLWFVARRRDWTFYVLLAAVSLWLALGPQFGLYRLVHWWPGLNLIRVPSRYTLLTILGLAIMAAAGFERLSRGVGASAKRRFALFAGAMLVFEFATFPLGFVSSYPPSIPAVNQWLATRSKPFVVAEFPFADRLQSRYMLYSMVHWQKTIHGYSGMRPPLHAALDQKLQSFPDEDGLSSLADLGVNYLVIHPEEYPPGEWVKVRARLDAFTT